MTETTAPAETRPRPPHPGGGGRLPVIPGPWETAVRAWRRLRRMSTALMLLFALAVTSILATFIPQQPLVPTTVADWRTGEAGPGAAVAQAFDALGLFDVFGTWWFTALTVLLFVSLTGCLLPRWRAFARVVRRRPVAGRNLTRLTNHREIVSEATPDAVLAAADRLLARNRFRRRRLPASQTASGRRQVAGERGHWREGGSLVFHTSFYLLLAGAVIAHTYGFTGQLNIVEGSSFADTRISYGLAQPGRSFGLDDHRGFVVTLDDFTVRYHDAEVAGGWLASDFVSTITISEDGRAVRTEQVRVNHPVKHDGMKIYQARFGMAPRVVVRAGDTVVFDERVMLSDAGSGVWTGVAKVSTGGGSGDDARPQIALDMVFLANAAVDDSGVPYSRSPEADNPRLIADLYVGDLGLERPVPASEFDREEGTRLDPPAILAEGGSAAMAGGNLTVEFPELAMWSGFQVSHAPARWLLLLAGMLMLTGLLPSLYSYRRRLWVEACEADGPTRVTIAGVALQRKTAFADEFARLAGELEFQLQVKEKAG
ncbi:MAG TPA: cytochrome c biogenesis protein ResB [Egibacteraceae bacterium]|nr:cytochrome c biogenesis protein ResB [Egibacteraceae bacterium]